jgi:hypothetical protein
MSASLASDSVISLGEWSWIKMVGFWYIGRGEAIGVMDAGNPALNILVGIGGWEQDEFGLEYIGVEGIGCICWL